MSQTIVYKILNQVFRDTENLLRDNFHQVNGLTPKQIDTYARDLSALADYLKNLAASKAVHS